MTFEEYVKEELRWEEYRKAHPACNNCRNYYEEEGYPCCKYWDVVEEDYEHDKCEKWR